MPYTIADFIVLKQTSLGEFQQMVTQHLNMGYLLHGDTLISSSKDERALTTKTVYTQAVYKPRLWENPEPPNDFI